MKSKKPLITVYMPVFNAAKFLDQSINSILNQTFTNFEFIIIDDASTDNSWKIVKDYAKKDKRIIAIKNHINLGVSLTSNIAISMAKGKFLARMDADDISFPNRLQKQIDYLKQNSDTIAVGGQCVLIDENNNIIGNKTFPYQHQKLKNMIIWAVPMQQPSVMINLTKLPKDFNWYAPSETSAEEIDLMFRLMNYGQIANTSEFLLFYRHLDNSLSHKNPKKTFWITLQSRINAIKNGYNPTIFGIILNIIQILVILLVPNKIISNLWYLIRGIRNTKNEVNISIPYQV